MEMDELSNLKDQLATQEKVMLDFKEKTKQYIQKITQDHQEALQKEKESNKNLQVFMT